jgi:membrane protease YdiL (CAAX protease family)
MPYQSGSETVTGPGRDTVHHVLAVVNLLIVVVVVAMLTRASIAAWRNRVLAVAVWRRIRPRHVIGSLGLIVIVLLVAVVLATFVPVTQFGLGSLVGIEGNAVFAPVEDVLLDSPPAAPSTDGGESEDGRDWRSIALVAGFCLLLLALFPWLAYSEERMFREGLERAGTGRQIAVALRFGLTHLIMLIPIAAALAIGVAGFAYGVVYRRAYRAAAETALVPAGMPTGLELSDPRARAEAVLASTVWHTTFNSLLVVLLIVTIGPTLL